MSKKTHTNPLSKQEIEKLRKNPYVASVTTNTVRFTEAFKEQAYEKKRQGIPVMETMRQCGIDPEILGASRVEGFSYTLNKKAKQESGFSDRRSLASLTMKFSRSSSNCLGENLPLFWPLTAKLTIRAIMKNSIRLVIIMVAYKKVANCY